MKWNKAGFVLVILIGSLHLSSPSQANECEVTTYKDFDYLTAIEGMMTPFFELDTNTTALGIEVKDILNASAGDDRIQLETWRHHAFDRS